jgi:hypothetical protein
MADRATRCYFLAFMTIDAPSHRRHFGSQRDRIHLRDVAMTLRAFHPRVGMRSVIPIHKSWDCVHSHPRNRLFCLSVLGQLSNGWPVLGHGLVAGHANLGGRKCHEISGLGIYVAELTGQQQRGMPLVAERKGLLRGKTFRSSVPEVLCLRRLREATNTPRANRR